jgi:hypothetical protein
VEVRNFLKTSERWKDYADVDVQWIRHHNPDLVILDSSGDKVVKRFDLNGYTEERLEQLLEREGVKKKF